MTNIKKAKIQQRSELREAGRGRKGVGRGEEWEEEWGMGGMGGYGGEEWVMEGRGGEGS